MYDHLGEQDDSGHRRWLGDRGTGQKGKRTHGYGQYCGDCWGKGSIRGLNGNGKNTIKIKLKKLKVKKLKPYDHLN